MQKKIVFHKTATLKTGSLKEATNGKQLYLNSKNLDSKNNGGRHSKKVGCSSLLFG
jgi:hypothetical protein